MSSQYAQALEQQRRFARWLASPAGATAFHDQYTDMRKVRQFYQAARVTLAAADPYSWAPEMCGVLEALSADMPRWTLRREALPTDFGFCWFGAPLVLPETSVRVMAITWGVWTPSAAGASSGLEPNLIASAYTNDPMAADDGGIVPLLTFAWRPGVAMDVDDLDVGHATAQMERINRRVFRYSAAIFALLEQRIFVTTPEGLDRAALRRLKKAQVRQPPAILVVRLRRQVREGNDPTGQPREWSRPWIVRAHWRQQFYPSDGSHRPILILPYLKAKDAPGEIISAERVFAVIR